MNGIIINDKTYKFVTETAFCVNCDLEQSSCCSICEVIADLVNSRREGVLKELKIEK